MMVQESSVFFFTFFWTQKKSLSFSLSFFLCVCGFRVWCVYPIFFFTKVGCLFRYLRQKLEK